MNIGNGLNLELLNHQKYIDVRLKKMQNQNFVQRLWNKEKNLWKDLNVSPETSMGWLNITSKMVKAVPMIEGFCKTINLAGFKHIVLMGMGGSSLSALVFQQILQDANGIKFIVLDSTDPEAIRKIENEVDICKTLFIISSKSGTTAEIVSFYDYFFSQVYLIKEDKAGENFIVITDEGSPLVELAMLKKFRKIFINFPDIGGRYSALSYFGMVPAALMGINIKALLERTLNMVNACGPEVPVSQNPGVVLGTVIAELASKGYDKLAYLLPPTLSVFGLWLEQLLAESLGKNSKGILPLNGSPLIEIDAYGKDRCFLQVEFLGKQNDIQSKKLEDLILSNYPVINILINDEMDLGQEFFRWQIATATAGAILDINPFNQPDVQQSKKYTDRLLKEIEHSGKLSEMQPTLIDNSLHYYTNRKTTNSGGDERMSAKSLIEKNLYLIKPGDYITLHAYLPEQPAVKKYLSEIQLDLQKKLHVAVTIEFGPRYLHSTGQYHKGGPNNGIFIQLISDSLVDIKIPGRSYTFNLLKRAQAIGDMEALINHQRNVILIDLGKDFINGLNSFKQIVEKIEPLLFHEFETKHQLINQVETRYKFSNTVSVNIQK